MHECDSKIMMYNFNIRRNIAHQEKKKREEDKMNIECAREKKTNNKDRHTEKKIFFSLQLMKTHMIYK